MYESHSSPLNTDNSGVVDIWTLQKQLFQFCRCNLISCEANILNMEQQGGRECEHRPLTLINSFFRSTMWMIPVDFLMTATSPVL